MADVHPESTPVRETPDGVVLSLHVQPNALVTECVGRHGDAFKVKIASPPVDGAANDALRRFLSRRFAVPLAAVEIQGGATGRRKRVLIRGLRAADVHRAFPV